MLVLILVSDQLRQGCYDVDITIVRQAILCPSDTTMEAAWNSNSSSGGGSGEEVFETERSAHTCRDWNKIRMWLEKNKKAGT